MAVDVERRLITVEEYHKMGEAGILKEKGIELIKGEILKMSPIGSKHAGIVAKLARLLFSQLSNEYILWVQNPINLDSHSEPEPDLAILKYRKDFYTNQLPTGDDILLIIEVADSSLDFDQQVKLPLYAKAKIPAYSIINLQGKEYIHYQRPKNNKYTLIEMFGVPDTVKLQDLSLSIKLDFLLEF